MIELSLNSTCMSTYYYVQPPEDTSVKKMGPWVCTVYISANPEYLRSLKPRFFIFVEYMKSFLSKHLTLQIKKRKRVCDLPTFIQLSAAPGWAPDLDSHTSRPLLFPVILHSLMYSEPWVQEKCWTRSHVVLWVRIPTGIFLEQSNILPGSPDNSLEKANIVQLAKMFSKSLSHPSFKRSYEIDSVDVIPTQMRKLSFGVPVAWAWWQYKNQEGGVSCHGPQSTEILKHPSN